MLVQTYLIVVKKIWKQASEEKRGTRIGGKSQKMMIKKKTIQLQRGKRPRNE